MDDAVRASLLPELQAALTELGFTSLTPIQQAAIPPLLAGRDVVAEARTGSGKTAAFALPLLQHLELRIRKVQALVLCPTRELTAQVASDVRKLGRRLNGLRVLPIAGGAPAFRQREALAAGAHVVVGTPGRILDHLHREALDLRNVSLVVLDEADRMLDMGFSESMNEILAALPSTRQTALFSATFPRALSSLTDAALRDPERLRPASEAAAAIEIAESAWLVTEEEKLSALGAVLSQVPHERALVFTNFKRVSKEVAAALSHAGAEAQAIHGDLVQSERDEQLVRFRNRSTVILVATDVAARGLDVSGLDLVVNYQLPTRRDAYIHRIGRTGRAGRPGAALSLVSPQELPLLEAIESHTGRPIARITFEPGTVHKGEAARGRPTLATEARKSGPMRTLHILGGRRDKLRPGDILGALTGEAGGLSGDDIGDIEIGEIATYVAIRADCADRALRGLQRGRIKGKRFRVRKLDSA